MPVTKVLRLKVNKRRYSQLKKTSVGDNTENQPNHSPLPSDESFYRQIFERNRAVKMIVDPETAQIIEVNAAACAFYGYSREQFIKLNVKSLSALSESEIVSDMQQTVTDAGKIFESRHRLASGEVRDVEIFSGSFEVNQKPYLYAIIQDITARKQAEKALRESEALYRLFAYNMPDSAVFMFDRNMRYTLAEGPFLKRFGSIYENIIGKTVYEALPEAAANFLAPIHQRALNGETFSYERVLEEYAYQAFVTPVRDDSGQIVGGMILSRDISEAKRAEAALRESEARFHSLVDLAPVGIIQTDTGGKRVFCNSHWCEMAGITLEQALGDEHYETIYSDDLPTAAGAWEQMMTTHMPFDNLIFRYQRPDKSTVWVSGNGRPLYDAQGNVIGYLGAVTDISHLKALEDTLLISESRFRTLVNLAPVRIVETDVHGNPIFTNARWHSLSGITESEPLGEKASSTIHPDDREWISNLNRESTQNTRAIDNVEYRFLHPDGKVVWVSDSSRPLINPDGSVGGFIIAMTDITERKRLEEALRNNEEQLRLITDNVQDLITQNDMEGKIVFASPSSRTMLGYEPEELVGRLSLDIVHPDDRLRLSEAFDKTLEAGEHYLTVECRLRHTDGHYLWAETIIKFIFDEHSEAIGGVFISRDVSERKRSQDLTLEKERLQSALDQEHELSNMKTRMMERIAHEFRTPLAVIQSSTETLTSYLDRLTPEQRTAKSTTIKGQIQRLTDMLQEIGLAVNGSFTPDRIHRQPIDVSATCRDLAAELEQQFNLPNKYVLNLPETSIVSLDPHIFKNAVRQIMRNAARFSGPSAPINVGLSRDEHSVTLRVTDHGIGIMPHERSHIFEPFFRGSNISEISGLGVGLTIARAAVEAHGGTITFDSVLGEGTTFIINLPV